MRNFKIFAKLTQAQLHNFFKEFLIKNYGETNVYDGDGYIYATGKIPIALVAHMDTVFKSPPKKIYFDTEESVMWSPDGLGADDRAGVYLIWKIIKSGLRPSIILTEDEEKGCLGAGSFIKDFEEPKCETNFVIQLDRRGYNDCVFYECDNKKFVKYIEKFGFKETWGTYTDIVEICPDWKIAGVNLSVGYINEHHDTETLHFRTLLETYEKVRRILTSKNIPKFEYIPMMNSWYNSYKYWNSVYHYNLDDDVPKISEEVKCSYCHTKLSDWEIFPVKTGDERKTIFLCPDCVSKHAYWCEFCYEAFLPSSSKSSCMCADCLKGDKIYELPYKGTN